MEKIKNLSLSTSVDEVEVIHIQILCHLFHQEYFVAINCCVDKYTEKLK